MLAALVAARNHINIETLLRAGVKFYELRAVVLHSKSALIDGVWAAVGSTDLNSRSFLHSHEVNSAVLGVASGSQAQAMFDKDLTASDDVVTVEQWESRPIDQCRGPGDTAQGPRMCGAVQTKRPRLGYKSIRRGPARLDVSRSARPPLQRHESTHPARVPP